jgi:hypothetical protein
MHGWLLGLGILVLFRLAEAAVGKRVCGDCTSLESCLAVVVGKLVILTFVEIAGCCACVDYQA